MAIHQDFPAMMICLISFGTYSIRPNRTSIITSHTHDAPSPSETKLLQRESVSLPHHDRGRKKTSFYGWMGVSKRNNAKISLTMSRIVVGIPAVIVWAFWRVKRSTIAVMFKPLCSRQSPFCCINPCLLLFLLLIQVLRSLCFEIPYLLFAPSALIQDWPYNLRLRVDTVTTWTLYNLSYNLPFVWTRIPGGQFVLYLCTNIELHLLQTETTGGNKERGKLVFRKQLILLLTVTSFYQNYSGQESKRVFELGCYIAWSGSSSAHSSWWWSFALAISFCDWRY